MFLAMAPIGRAQTLAHLRIDVALVRVFRKSRIMRGPPAKIESGTTVGRDPLRAGTQSISRPEDKLWGEYANEFEKSRTIYRVHEEHSPDCD
jgi:hypothetical protein